MATAACCDAQQLIWKSAKVGGRWSDMQLCAACGHIHRMESWLIPIKSPTDVSCINCGGTVKRPTTSGLSVSMLAPGERRKPEEPKCEDCGFTQEEDRAHHERLAELHPDGSLIKAAAAADASGRHILALKLATAEIRWGRDVEQAWVLRIQALREMGLVDRALEEAWDWSVNPDSDISMWPLIATIEAERGDLVGAINATERGIEADRGDIGLWMDYAELLAHVDNRPNAANAATRGLDDARYQLRSLAVLNEVAERYYEEGLLVEAIQALGLAGHLQAEYSPMAWLRARIAAQHNQTSDAIEWLETTIRLEPGHQEAIQALETLRPSRRKGWFGFRKE